MSEPNWKTEFPDFDSMPDIPANWTDISWHNDTCPSFECGNVRIWIDYADPEQREFSTPTRFAVVPFNEDADHFDALLESDDWSEILTFVASL
jgi:hypothetical protein